MIYKVETKIGSKTFTIETGRMAKQANGAAVVSYGDSVVLTTVVMSGPRPGSGDFLPLTVDYREKTSAAGKIPGGFFKREGRPTTEEILTMRLIDRPLRPLFPEGFANEIQIMSLVLSAESDFDPDILAINSASAALVTSNIPFNGPVAAVRLGRQNGKFMVNPTLPELKEGDLDVVIVGTEDAVLMVEGQAKEIPDEILTEAIQFAHQELQVIIKIQKELHKKTGIVPIDFTPVELNQQLYETVRKEIDKEYRAKLQIKTKHERREALNEIREKVITKHCANLSPEEEALRRSSLNKILSQLERNIIRELILKGIRIDGRNTEDIRPITCEVGILPRTHGSALFTRGETQALTVATLGTSIDEQRVDGLADEYRKKFMLHYNFPPFSVGETKPVRGPSRREIGHGHLAECALKTILPPEEKFPYTIRVVSDILESNGSSSMATVCGATMCLMDAGVPIKSPVAGIAMGLVKEGENVQILSDILGNEDKCGDMDFKIAGTAKGITAIQMDIKISGISTEIMQKALIQAKQGRLFILDKMSAVLSNARTELSAYAPKLVRLMINPDKIGRIIGSGGKTIRKLEEETKATIEINDGGEIIISAVDQGAIDKAKQEIEKLTEEAEVGKIYPGKVVSIKDFGAFVEILPGQEGLVHISELSNSFIRSVDEVVKRGQIIQVRVIGIDESNKIKLSHKEFAPPPPVQPDSPSGRPPDATGDPNKPRPYNGRPKR